MRYSPDHKATTRDRLVASSGALAKEGGFAASGVDALARSAGLTSGAFYKHFDGKDELLAAICERELSATCERFSALEPGAEAQFLRVIDAYLSLGHVRNPGAGCPLPALSAEVGRASSETRAVFEQGFEALVDVVGEKLADRTLASALVTHCVGAVLVARALGSEEAQRAALAAARVGARRMLAGG